MSSQRTNCTCRSATRRNRPRRFTLNSADIDHSFWVSPGRQNRPDSQPHKYHVDRSAGARALPGAVRAVLRNPARQDAAAGRSRRARIRRWIQQQSNRCTRRRLYTRGEGFRARPASTATPSPAHGPRRFGPDLTHLMSRDTIASGECRIHPRISGNGFKPPTP